MQIVIEHYDKKLIAQIPDESTITEVMEIFSNLLVVDGYAKECILEYIIQKSIELEG
jgi:hypothetical protein